MGIIGMNIIPLSLVREVVTQCGLVALLRAQLSCILLRNVVEPKLVDTALTELLKILWDKREHGEATGYIIRRMRTLASVNESALRNTLRISASGCLRRWFLRDCGLSELPGCFGTMRCSESLGLNHNRLSTLPESFGNLVVGGNLYLDYNQLVCLPSTFACISINGDCCLNNNQLGSLPEAFNLTIGGSLYLSHNQLTALPESFGGITVPGDLHLDHNKLDCLPESFGGIHVEGSLYLDNNCIVDLPASFGQISVIGNLHVDDILLENLPQLPNVLGEVLGPDDDVA